MTVGAFWRTNYWPWAQKALKPSTQKSYGEIWRTYMEAQVQSLRLCDFRKRDVITALEYVALELRRADTTVHRCATLLGSIFGRACDLDLIEHNPVRDFKVPSAGLPKKKGEAFTAAEAEGILRILTGRARVAVALAWYGGLRPEEIEGLQWPDYDGDHLHIRRAVWNGRVVTTKTEDSAVSIPVMEPLREILDAWRPQTEKFGPWIVISDFATPARLANIARREVKPILEKTKMAWKGWYGFRRGTATVLSEDLNASEDQVRSVLRHAANSPTARQLHRSRRQEAPGNHGCFRGSCANGPGKTRQRANQVDAVR
jgi:integrase